MQPENGIDPADLDELTVEEAEYDDPLADFIRFAFRPEPWMKRAKCKDLGLDVKEFFPHRGTSQKVAKAACARCPVKADCADYADRSHTEHGIWGGRIRRRGEAPKRRSAVLHLAPIQPDIGVIGVIGGTGEAVGD